MSSKASESKVEGTSALEQALKTQDALDWQNYIECYSAHLIFHIMLST